MLLAMTLQKNELEHATHIHRNAVLVFHLGILQHSLPILHTYTHLQQEHVGLRLLFADLLCGNWVICSQNGIITGEFSEASSPTVPACAQKGPLSSLGSHRSFSAPRCLTFYHPSHVFCLRPLALT